MNYETSSEIEIAIANHFDIRKNIIVPNVSWGMFGYELDLCILNCKSMYASEVEIKISKSDLKRDQKKYRPHERNGNLIRQLWFAMPEKLRGCEDLVPERAGIIFVKFVNNMGITYEYRRPKINKLARKWSIEEAFKLARLGTMRIWSLKEKSNQMMNYKKEANCG